MKKNKSKDGIVVNAGNGNYIPNIVRGGAAIPIGKKNFYYMQGRKHEQGGIDVGRNAKTGLEVEGEEVMQVTPNEVRVYSSVPFLRGVSPAELVLNGADANKVFAAQEKYKDNNRINDDGTKYRTGGNIYKQNVKTVVADNTNINKPIIFDTVERVVSSSDKLNVPIGTKYSELSSKQKIQLLSSDKLNKDKKGLKIVSPEFDILTGIRGLTNLPKGFINNSATKNISTNYYRQGSKGLIDDAKKTGVVSVKSDAAPISSNDKKVSILRKTFNVPFWSKGVKWYDDKASNAKDMIVSIGDNNLDWQMINQHGTFVNNIKKAASRRTPIYNGTVNNTPSNLFEYYRRYPIIGYRNITNGEPTIPITGLDAIANNLNDKNKKQYGGSKTNNMRKLVSINGNVKNGLIHTPNQDVLAYNKERKPRFNGRYSKPGLHNLELLVSDLILPKGKVNIEPDVPKRLGWVEAHNRLVGADISQKPLDAKKDNTNVVHTISETERRTRKFQNGGSATYKGKQLYQLPFDPDGLYYQKTVDNDLNVMPVQDDVAKTRNTDNILLGVNLGSSVLDAVMGNIYANQMHGYTAPNITAPTIKNPGEIKLNEEDLKDIPAPILMAAAKLKTRYNANPQLSKIEDDTRRIMGEIGRNTSNSRVALARKQRAALQGQQAKNEVYGRKENIETELINKDKLNQQEVTARNLARYDQYNQALAAQRANRARLRLAADTANIQNKLAVSTANAQLKSQTDRFNTANKINQLVHQAGIDAAKAEARSNIFSGMLGNIGSALNTWNRNKRQAKLDEETLRVLGLRAPNANKLVLSALGY